jgi:hypothetical protein
MVDCRLMIVMGERAWTLAALHLACAMARRGEASVVLLHMVPVMHPLMLGTAAGLFNFSDDADEALLEMAETAEDYGVSLDVWLFQYAGYWSGLVNAAAQVEATAVIAQIRPSPVPYWQVFRRKWLGRRLSRQGQLFFTLDDLKPSLVLTPSLNLQNRMARQLFEEGELGHRS